MRKICSLGLLALAVIIAPTAGRAAFPDRPVRIIVPFPPGGGTDIISRVIGAAMSDELGQPVIVENKAGAGTVVGTAAAAGSAADGYTLVMATFAHAVNPSLKTRLPLRPRRGRALAQRDPGGAYRAAVRRDAPP